MEYLEHIITAHILILTKGHTENLNEMKHRPTLTDLCPFPDMFDLYQCVVPIYDPIAAPFNPVHLKTQPPKIPLLNDDQAYMFKTRVEAEILSPILLLLRPSLPYTVDTNACDHQLGAALFQTKPDGERKLF